mmetsp:Transcript_12083/g.32519  ORF Transcript_12083/g.32519 Transcript_12083/m.32519 type:complete len:96 (+) Transcript_12083:873-1160(+)
MSISNHISSTVIIHNSDDVKQRFILFISTGKRMQIEVASCKHACVSAGTPSDDLIHSSLRRMLYAFDGENKQHIVFRSYLMPVPFTRKAIDAAAS